jgi:hypothetical protein
MEGSDPFERYVTSSFEMLGVVVDDVQLAVMRAADAIYRPQIDALIEADLEGTAPEPDADFSKPPRTG